MSKNLLVDLMAELEYADWLRDGGPWTLEEWRVLRRGPASGWYVDHAGVKHHWKQVYPALPLSNLLAE